MTVSTPASQSIPVTAPSEPAPQKKVAVDEVVIRFTRQIFYEDNSVFQAEVRKTPILLRGGPFRADIEEQLEEFRLTFSNRVKDEHYYQSSPDDIDPDAEQSAQELQALGRELYNLLPEPIREGLPRLIQRATDRGHYLRLILEVRAGDQADQLLSMPWEIMFIEKQQTYLGLMPRVMLVRRMLDAVRLSPVDLQPPFNIVHVIADAAKSNYSSLAPELQQTERTAIAQAVAPDGRYHLVAQPGSVEALQAALRTEHYQALHFLGHGDLDPQTQQGYLIFADAEEAPQLVTGEHLQRLLTITPEVQLVVLNACQGANVTGGSAAALKLVYSGIPYVIAMQDEILQKSAGVFAQTFYTELQRGQSVEAAVMHARHAVAAAGPLTIDWSLPALYTNVGIAEAGQVARVGNQFERWLSEPEGKRQLAQFNLLFGAIHLVVALLLWSSSAAPPLPAIELTRITTILLLPVPPLVTLGVWWRMRSLLPERSGWSVAAHGALLLRLFATAAITLGIAALYGWFGVSLLAALGFWALLSTAARILLLTVILAPGAFISWQITTAHGTGFVTNATITQPSVEWQEAVVVFAGYFLLVIPLVALWLAPAMIAPPLGNLVVGGMLVALGFALRNEAV
jgi:CHAT domain-containing protein